MKVFFWESPPDLIGQDKNFDMFFLKNKNTQEQFVIRGGCHFLKS